MSLFDRIRAAFAGPLTAGDREVWAQARTLDDLGELTAQWLEGRIDSQPGYYGPVDVDEDLSPGMTEALAACNRAGFLTHSSQAGSVDYDQQADVVGFATPQTAARIAAGLDGSEYRHAELPVRGRFERSSPDAHLGWHLTSAEVGDMYDGVGPDAVDAVREATQVSVYDPVTGRNTLWADLQAAVSNQTSTDDDTDGM
jgi:hypothetical protein